MPERFALPFDDLPPNERGPLTVSELSLQIKHHLETRFSGVVVEGEISNCKQWSSGHLYFTLKDDASQIRAVMFRMSVRQLKFRPEDGMHVVVRGRVGVYEVKGEYQLICDALEPHGLGALQAAFEQLKRRLQAEGLFGAARKRPLPILPRRIGVVSSLDGAALRDIVRVLTTRHPSAQIVVRSARVQGEDAPRDLIRALAAIVRVPGVDVVIIGRGGGSAEDLWAFNDESLARAIAAAPVPVISAVGHEVDFTIADFVADLRAATPSNAAEMVVERADHFRTRIDRAHDRLRRAMTQAATGGYQRAERLRLRLSHWPVTIAMRDRDLEELRLRLDGLVRDRTARLGQRFEALRRRLERRDVRQIAADMRTRIVRVEGQLRTLIAARHLAARARAGQVAGQLHALSPLAVLGRGYAVCWNDARTSIIRSAPSVEPGDRVRVTLAEGELACRVESRGSGPHESVS